jgi:hypothetical protein
MLFQFHFISKNIDIPLLHLQNIQLPLKFLIHYIYNLQILINNFNYFFGCLVRILEKFLRIYKFI